MLPEQLMLDFYASRTANAGFLFFQNNAGCRFLLMLTMYFRLTNYTW
jgi:hypothetical protein